MSHNHKSLDGEGRLEFLVPPKRTIANLLAVKNKHLAAQSSKLSEARLH